MKPAQRKAFTVKIYYRIESILAKEYGLTEYVPMKIYYRIERVVYNLVDYFEIFMKIYYRIERLLLVHSNDLKTCRPEDLL